MPIILPEGLPATGTLRSEGRSVATAPVRGALRIALLNLMPDKIRTETQFARHLGASERPVELVLARLRTYRVRHAEMHVERFYRPVDDVVSGGIDALIVTGAPVETMPFQGVAYWSELSEIILQAGHAVPHRLFVCWAAQAALFASFGIPKVELPAKAFGVFDQRVLRPDNGLTAGMGLRFPVPVSRHTTTRAADIMGEDLTLLSDCPTTGAGLAESRDGRDVYSFNHFEYEASVLADEYRRDLLNGVRIARPCHYFVDGDPAKGPDFRWGATSRRFFRNWLDRVAGDARMTPGRPVEASCLVAAS
jgi:homoserine O-succinyltransferase